MLEFKSEEEFVTYIATKSLELSDAVNGQGVWESSLTHDGGWKLFMGTVRKMGGIKKASQNP